MTKSGFQLDESAPRRYERFARPIMRPFVDALLVGTGVGPGQRVLDLACGTGFLARAAAELVGASGRVSAVDVNQGMLAVAADSHPGIDWVAASADSMPFPDNSFDVVLCQQGLQFFPDFGAALTEVNRVLESSGRFGATVWSALDRSPYMVAQHDAVRRFLGSEQAESFEAAFACDADTIAAVLERSGLGHIESVDIRAPIQLPDFRTFAAGHLSALPWGIALLDAGLLERAAESIVEAIPPSEDGSVTVEIHVLMTTATSA